MRRPAVGIEWAALAALLGAAGLTAACGEAAAPEPTGRLETLLIDDPGGELASTLPEPRVFFAHHKNFGGDYFHGTLGGRLEIHVSEDGREYHRIALVESAGVSLQDSERGTRLAAGSLPVGVYRYVRLTLEEGAATLATGSEIGGLDLPYDVTLGLGAQDPVVAEKRLVQPLQVGPEGTALLLVDFNSERWVTEDNVLAGLVRPEELSAALTAGPSAILAALFLSGL